MPPSRLSALLKHASVDPQRPLDVAAMLTSGRRRRAYQRIGSGALGVVAVAGVVLAWGALSSPDEVAVSTATSSPVQSPEAEPASTTGPPRTADTLPTVTLVLPTSPASPAPRQVQPRPGVTDPAPPPVPSPTPDDPDTVILPFHEETVGPKASRSGTLRGSKALQGGCVWLEAAGTKISLRWPIGFRARFTSGDDTAVELLDGDGRVVARDGNPILISGGPFYFDQAMERCQVSDTQPFYVFTITRP